MTESNLLEKIRSANLIGRGGAGFPVARKWLAVQGAQGEKKYVIVNVSEREPGVFKDFFILEHHAEVVFRGITLAMDFIGSKECVFNFNEEYYEKLQSIIDPLIAAQKERGRSFRIFKEKPSYIGGEETALMEAIEDRRTQPRLKPPYPVESGLYGCPTLVHNVETLFDIACIAEGTYEAKRFYSISGAVPHGGVFHLPAAWTILQVLTETKNIPKKDFFVQEGGGASGLVLNREQIEDHQATGAGAIIVHLQTENPRELILSWLTFSANESCGKCTPCREGTYQLKKMVKESKKIPWEKMEPILDALEKTSFCPLGKSVPVPIRSYRENVL